MRIVSMIFFIFSSARDYGAGSEEPAYGYGPVVVLGLEVGGVKGAGNGDIGRVYVLDYVVDTECVTGGELEMADEFEVETYAPAPLGGVGLEGVGVFAVEAEGEDGTGVDCRAEDAADRGDREAVFEVEGDFYEVFAHVVVVAGEVGFGVHAGVHEGEVSAEADHGEHVFGGETCGPAALVGAVKEFVFVEAHFVDVETGFDTPAEAGVCGEEAAEGCE